MVYGAPEEEQHGVWRDMASRVTKIALAERRGRADRHGTPAPSVHSAPKCAAVSQISRDPLFPSTYCLPGARRTLPRSRCSHDARRLGTSQYTLRKLIRHAFNMMTGFSVLPLQIASVVGFVFTVIRISGAGIRNRGLSDPRRKRAGLPVPGLSDRHVFGSADVCARNYRRVSGAHAFPHDGPAGLRHPAANRRAGRARGAAAGWRNKRGDAAGMHA